MMMMMCHDLGSVIMQPSKHEGHDRERRLIKKKKKKRMKKKGTGLYAEGQIRMMTKSEFQITKGNTEKPSSRDKV